MNRLFLVAAAATTLISLTSVTNAQAEQAEHIVPVVISADRFDAGPAPLPLADGEIDIVFEDGAEFYEHPLNDAWLGMPFKGLKGDVIGYVIDAPVDANGEITEVHVGKPQLEWHEQDAGSETADLLVFPSDRVALTDDAVILVPSDAELVANLIE